MKKWLLILISCFLFTALVFAQAEKQELPYDYKIKSFPSDDQKYKDAYQFFLQGFQFLQSREPQAAVNSFQKAVQLYPDYVEAYFHMSAAYNMLQKLQLSIDCLKKAVTIKPDYDQAYMGLGFVYQAVGDNENAKLNFDKAIVLYKNHGDSETAAKLESVRKQVP